MHEWGCTARCDDERAHGALAAHRPTVRPHRARRLGALRVASPHAPRALQVGELHAFREMLARHDVDGDFAFDLDEFQSFVGELAFKPTLDPTSPARRMAASASVPTFGRHQSVRSSARKNSVTAPLY